MIGEYYNLTLARQREITKIANRKRRFLNVWQKQQLAIWKRALDRGNKLPEQQLFFMRDIEAKLTKEGWIK